MLTCFLQKASLRLENNLLGGSFGSNLSLLLLLGLVQHLLRTVLCSSLAKGNSQVLYYLSGNGRRISRTGKALSEHDFLLKPLFKAFSLKLLLTSVSTIGALSFLFLCV